MRTFFDQHRAGLTAAVLTVAVILLLAAGFLAVSLLQDGPIAAASPTLAPSATESDGPSVAESTPFPSPVPSGEVVFGRVFAGVVLVDNLRIRAEPVNGAVLATLMSGDILQVEGEPQTLDGSDWYPILKGTSTSGWVSAGPEGQYLELRRYVAQSVPATVEGVAGGPTGYLAWGVSAGRDREHRDRFVAVSRDGEIWELGPVPAQVSAAAAVVADYGPAGWLLAASNPDNTATAGIWQSADGLEWDAVDANVGPSLAIQSMVGSTSGYLVDGYDYGNPDWRFAVLASQDGASWREVDIGPVTRFGQTAEAGDGFVAWSEDPEQQDGPNTIRYSPDGGTTWVDPSMDGTYPAPSHISAMAAVDRHFVALTIDGSTEGGAVGTWTATLPLRSDARWPALEWRRQTSADALLAAAAIGRLVALDGRVVALGNTYERGEPVAWSTLDGSSWEQVAAGGQGMAAALGPSAVGAYGLVGVAHDLTAAGDNPRFWHSTDAAAWEGEASPAIASVEHSVIGACPERPSTMLDFVAVPGAIGAECFGDAPISFRAWLTQGGGCGGYQPGIFEPGWLASPFASLALTFTPDEVEYNSWNCGWGTVHPDLTALPPDQQWVQVTGHWADPASATCRLRPDRAYPGLYAARSLAFQCRTMFVATAVAASP